MHAPIYVQTGSNDSLKAYTCTELPSVSMNLPSKFVDDYDVYTSGLAEHEWLWKPRLLRVPSVPGERTFTDPTDGATRPIWNEDLYFDVVCCGLCRDSLRRLPMVLYTNYLDSSGEMVYPDLQFERFGNLCLQCRDPHADEGGHFVDGNLCLKDAASLGPYMDPCMPVDIQKLVFGYYDTRRVFPKFPRMDEAKFPLLKIHKALRSVYENLELMSVPGVEHIGSGWQQKLEITLDMRWFVPKECSGSSLCQDSYCKCICVRAQVQNIQRKLRTYIPDDHQLCIKLQALCDLMPYNDPEEGFQNYVQVVHDDEEESDGVFCGWCCAACVIASLSAKNIVAD